MNLKLMIVDDHAGMRTIIRKLVVAPGDSVVECASGDEALKIVREFRPDCVTMDVNMPGKCAFETTRNIRSTHPAARIIFVSSHNQPDYRRAAYEAGAIGYVNKENLSELVSFVSVRRLLTNLRVLQQPGNGPGVV